MIKDVVVALSRSVSYMAEGEAVFLKRNRLASNCATYGTQQVPTKEEISLSKEIATFAGYSHHGGACKCP